MKKAWYKKITYLFAIFAVLLTLGSTRLVHGQGLDWLFGTLGHDIETLSEEDLQMINEVYASLKTFYIEDIPKEKLLEGALKGMVSATGDPYSEFLNKDESKVYEETEEGSFSGVGIQFMSRNGLITVISAIDGTPAAEAGIQPNDILLQADEVELTDMDTMSVMDLIRGPIGSEVVLTVQRADKTFEVNLTREEIPIITVEGQLDKEDKEVGHVKISQFNGTTYDELTSEIEKLRQEGAKRFIFDLRYNPGGLLDQALQISNMFLEDGQVIMQMQEGKAKAYKYEADDKEYGRFQVTEPYVLLVNEGSASASEILTGAIKENTSAPIVGTTTFGKGSVQTFLNANAIGELKLTFAKWLLPSGTWIHETGIEPTDIVEAEEVESVLAISPDSELKLGDFSVEVESLGLILHALGYLDQPLKYYNEEMEEAVKTYQEDKKLESTGIVASETILSLTDDIRTYFETHDKQYEEAVKILNDYAGSMKEAA